MTIPDQKAMIRVLGVHALRGLMSTPRSPPEFPCST